MNKDIRPSWDNFFMSLAYLVSARSSCLDRQVGAAVVKDKRILSTGYNGAPSGVEECTRKGFCIREQMREQRDEKGAKDYRYCYTTHAEANALINAAYSGTSSTKGATLYVTLFPCSDCLKLVINAGITHIVYAEGFNDRFKSNNIVEQMINESGITSEKIDKTEARNVFKLTEDIMSRRDITGKKPLKVETVTVNIPKNN
ncbi:MAG: hypothetical protein UU65_C0001G0148 [candidate division CPR2 bacterium GW2011_GWC1_41_48]|uniref:CMP/dCMP-type deaminase domain-containing protein n=1 Tax=candidate division CPR2 bacterium GW2011_GWC1_41_48 TaxID=1618344 RepID=A0A0G0Z9M9_UNCC2|nr:MAG: hypothetical protein UT47_C0001G0148 [candidate division CPR2 bacterium GW2011_GWC2_39_35]KKR28571.1 MAG: hypothetical protein UT59_C0024G0015 [candidate division CPR2 bacterium GW2011_GWD1_39_7]KKR29426.1 MAG: hypothetical protein UT60_C0002G0017 [candidate division CPR2 bacterium GW2011_GWD2_39_7]KKS09743.1 MAG: hypothetical protein UU65_C0001G0148 [candidate division CPR2 bacterium GW2011_GWC1_41_48]OGB71247.1 MAG: hypothetical protein A2Y26_00510 [candidate division CPR2 bacterium G